MTGRRVGSWIFYAVVAVVFGYAGWTKVAQPEPFLSSLLTYQVFPYKLAVATALFAPWLELTLAFALATGVCRKGATWLTAGLLILFVVLILQAAARGLSIDCGCYGSNRLESGLDYALKIGENLLLLAALWLATVFEKSKKKAGTA